VCSDWTRVELMLRSVQHWWWGDLESICVN